jgi:hypothetical protein
LVIGRLVQIDRSETGGGGKTIENGKKEVKGGREERGERERDERDKLVCFVRCCGRGEMGLGYATCERTPKKDFISPTDTFTMSA